MGLFSLSERRADRYIFPAYDAVGAVTFVAHLLAGRLGLPTIRVGAP